jgi:dTDP-glucose 4,6-dehydratase
MKLLVTGGYGFIGSHFIDLAIDGGDSVYVVDEMTYAANPLNISNEKKELINFERVNICNFIQLSHFAKKNGPFDCIINFAAETHVDRSIEVSSNFFTTNINGVVNLLELMRIGISKKMIQVSTDEVYGSIESGKWNEFSILDPRSPYSASKASAELICNAYANTYGLNVIITRSANNFGQRQAVEKLIPKSNSSIIDGKPIELYGNGSNTREWIFVKDHCSIIYRLVYSEKTDFKLYNIGGEEFSNLDIARKLFDISGVNENIKFIKDRPGHDFRYSVNDARIRNEFGYNFEHNLDNNLVETYEWYRKNLDWINLSKKRNSA